MKIAFYSSHHFERSYFDRANHGAHDFLFIEESLGADTVKLARGCEAVVIFTNDDAQASVLHDLSSLGVRFIALRCAGFNNVDLDVAKSLRLRVANVPDYSPYAVAEHAVALMLALNRRLPTAVNRTRNFNFSLEGLVGFDMHGKTVGVIGTGRIGRVIVKILHGFSCRILASDPIVDFELTHEYDLRYVSLEDLYRESDIISLHVPLVSSTHHLINQRSLAMMRRGVMLINTSRGGVVDTGALIAGLKTGHVGYAGLDVYERESKFFFRDCSNSVFQDEDLARLATFPNVLITGHQAFLTDTALTNIANTTLHSLNCWSQDKHTEYSLV